MTKERMKEIFKNHVPYGNLEMNTGPYIFYKEGELEIAVSFENHDHEDEFHEWDENGIYVFNLFINTVWYVNINGWVVNSDDTENEDAIINQLVTQWNQYADK